MADKLIERLRYIRVDGSLSVANLKEGERWHPVCQEAAQAIAALTAERDALREGNWPHELNPILSKILGTMCFQVIELAQLWRDTGTDIPKRAEDEQAFFLHAMLTHWNALGDEWAESWRDEIKQRIDQRKAALKGDPANG